MKEHAVFAPAWIVAIISLLLAFYLAAPIFAPVACALFIIALAWPLQRNLQRFLPRLLALAVVVCLIVLVLFAFVSITTWGAGRIVRSIIADIGRFQTLYSQLVVWLEGHGIEVAGIWAEHFNVGWIVRVLQGVTARLNTMLSFWIVVVVYVLLGLLDTEAISRNIRVAFSSKTASALIEGSALTASKLR